MIIAKLNIPNGEDRAQLVSILAFAGYKVSIEAVRSEWSSIKPTEYFVIVEEAKDE